MCWCRQVGLQKFDRYASLERLGLWLLHSLKKKKKLTSSTRILLIAVLRKLSKISLIQSKTFFSCFANVMFEQFSLLKNQITDLQRQNSELHDEVHLLTTKAHHELSQYSAPTYADKLRDTSTIILKPKNIVQTASKTKSDIITKINPANSNLEITDVRTVKNGGILLKCRNPEELTKLTQDDEFKGSYDIRDFKTPLPRLRIAGISEDINEDSIISFLTKQNKHIFTSSSQCKLLKYYPLKNRKNIFQIIIQVDIETYKPALDIGHCLIGLDGCNIFDAIEVFRCYNCNGLGHEKKACKNNLSCPRCGDKHHIKECKAEKFNCLNCCNVRDKNNLTEDDVSHATWDYNKCMFYKQYVTKVRTDLFGDFSK